MESIQKLGLLKLLGVDELYDLAEVWWQRIPLSPSPWPASLPGPAAALSAHRGT